MKDKLTAWLLCVVMAMLFLPAPKVYADDPVCEITGFGQFESLGDAVNVIPENTPTTVTMLQTINLTKAFKIDDSKAVTLNLNGHSININTPSGAALEVGRGGSLTTTGDGALNATGNNFGLFANQDAFVNITGVVGASGGFPDGAVGVFVSDANADVTVNGNVNGYCGVKVMADGTVTINGNVTGESCAAYAQSGGSLSVSGDASGSGAGSLACVQAYGSTIHIGNNVISDLLVQGTGVGAADGSTITVSGNVEAGQRGVSSDASDVTISGNVTAADKESGVSVCGKSGAKINIGGSAVGGTGGVKAESGSDIFVVGSVSGCNNGVNASQGATVNIHGDVIADDTIGVGVNAETTARVTVDGTIRAHKPMTFGAVDGSLVASNPNPGFLTYSDGGEYPSYILVKAGQSTPPTVVTNEVDASRVTPTTAFVSGSVTSDGGMTLKECGFVYGPDPNPAMTNNKVVAGSGGGDFCATLTVLIPGTTYHVRSYADSDAGTGYGEDRSFTTTPLGGGGGADSDYSSPPSSSLFYRAIVKGYSTPENYLPMTVEYKTKTATVNLKDYNSIWFYENPLMDITIPSVPGIDQYVISLSAPAFSDKTCIGQIFMSTDIGTLNIPKDMPANLSGQNGIVLTPQSTVAISIGHGDKSVLTNEEKEAVGGRPLIQLTLTVDGVQKEWNDPDSDIMVSIPYTPTAEELKHPEDMVVWYMDGRGKPVCVPGGHYNPETGTMAFLTSHFSQWAVGFNRVCFNDVKADDWYNDAVSFIAARGITNGMGSGYYCPEAALTRGDFLVQLMRTCEVDPDVNPQDNFSDAGHTYYTGYLAKARQLGISIGTGKNLFEPEKKLTRQEMFTMLCQALKVVKKLPESDAGKSLTDFADAGQIAPWAKEDVVLLVKSGIVGGSGGMLNPAAMVTRAEMAQVLYKLLSEYNHGFEGY